MSTQHIQLDLEDFDAAALEAPARCVEQGGLVAFPTETVYGIAANRDNPEALRRLLELRGSPEDKHLTLHIGDRDDIRRSVRKIPVPAQRLMARFWPGPLTIVFPDAGNNGLGIRYPHHPVALSFLKRAGRHVVAPSANRSGDAPAVTGAEVLERFPEGLDFVIDAGPTRHRKPSTVVRVHADRAEVLREGAIPRSVIDEVNYYQVLFVCTGNTCRSPMAEGLMKRLAADRLGVEPQQLDGAGLRILSAGTAAGSGAGAFEHAVAAVRERGVSLDDHRSQPVTVTLIEDSNLIFVMTASHRALLSEWAPDSTERIHLLDPKELDIKDPLFGSLDVYHACVKRIEVALGERASTFTFLDRTS